MELNAKKKAIILKYNQKLSEYTKNNGEQITYIEKLIDEGYNRMDIARMFKEKFGFAKDMSAGRIKNILNPIFTEFFEDKKINSVSGVNKKTKQAIIQLYNEGHKPKYIGSKLGLHEETISLKIKEFISEGLIKKRKTMTQLIHENLSSGKTREEVYKAIGKLSATAAQKNTIRDNYRMYKKRNNIA